MGQKVHPVGLRLGIIRSWDSKWFAKRQYAKLVHEDAKMRDFLKGKLFHAGVSRIEIARAADRARIR
ncbi:MAG: 30S ribosomal protein S3, partial [Syntrophobacterales bacterium]